ncbi:hypothetical protein ACQSSU_25040 [Micromonospora echinospora]
MGPALMFQKALILADRGDLPRALETLRAVLDDDPWPVLRVRALVVLAELLAASADPVTARDALTEALARAEEVEDADDLLDAEIRRARELLMYLT